MDRLGQPVRETMLARTHLSEVTARPARLAAVRKDDWLAGLSAMNWARSGGAWSCMATAAVLIVAWVAPSSTESAVANGDTRTVVFSNQHTSEQGSFTYMVNGVYDSVGARQAQLVHAGLATQRADQDGSAAVRHHLGSLSRVRLEGAGRRSFGVSVAADERDAAPAIEPSRRALPAHAGPRDRRAFRRRGSGADSRHRDADAGRRRRLLPDRRDMGAYRQRFGALLAAHEPRRSGAAFS